MKNKFRHLYILIFLLYIPAVAGVVLLSSKINVLKIIVFAVVLSALEFGWEVWLTYRGPSDHGWIWAYNPETTSGINWLGAPIEQYLFCPGIILCAILLWELVKLSDGKCTSPYMWAIIAGAVWNTSISIWLYMQSSKN